MTKTITYEDAGVNPNKAAEIIDEFSTYMKSRPRDPSILSGIGPFASCYSLKQALAQVDDPVLVTCCDGVGTKLKLALQWGDISGLGQDLVAMNVNDLLCAGAFPLVFLDYYACGKLEKAQLLQLLKGIQKGCELAECSLVGGETAEMPGLYEKEDFDLAGFSVGMADRRNLLGSPRVIAGDNLLAISSTGFHSNGYSLVRKILEQEGIRGEEKSPFGEMTWKQAVLKPTEIYVQPLKKHLSKLHALAHITGGGLFENLPRVLPKGTTARISAENWNIPPMFRWFQDKAGLSEEQLLSTFNCGVGMILVCDPANTSSIISQLDSAHLRCWNIGTVEKNMEQRTQVVWE